MTISARLFPRYIETNDLWSLRGPKGQEYGTVVDRKMLHDLSRFPEYCEGIGSASRLRFVRLLIPYQEMRDILMRTAFEAEKAEFDARHSKRIPAPTKYCVPEIIGIYRVYKHVAYRCSAVEPQRAPVNANCM